MIAKNCFFQSEDGPKSQHPVCWVQARVPSTGGSQWVFLEAMRHCPPPFITAHSRAGVGIKISSSRVCHRLLVAHCLS